MTTNNTNTLKPRQLQFIQWMDEHYSNLMPVDADTTFSRGELRTLAEKNGVKWAPAWIVKDTSRQCGRGEYRVPELAEYRGNATAPVTDDAAEARAEDILSPEEFTKAMDEHEAREREFNMI